MNTDTTTTKPDQPNTTPIPKKDKSHPSRSFTELRDLFFDVLTDDDLKNVARKLIDIAVEGNFHAIKLVLSYALGKPEAMWKAFEEGGAGFGVKRDKTKPTRPATSSVSSSSLPPLSASDLLAPGKTLPKSGFRDASEISLVNRKEKQRRK